jgi:hypothetical protein
MEHSMKSWVLTEQASVLTDVKLFTFFYEVCLSDVKVYQAGILSGLTHWYYSL